MFAKFIKYMLFGWWVLVAINSQAQSHCFAAPEAVISSLELIKNNMGNSLYRFTEAGNRLGSYYLSSIYLPKTDYHTFELKIPISVWFYLGLSVAIFAFLRLLMFLYQFRIKRRNRHLEVAVKIRTMQIQKQNKKLESANNDLQKLSIVARKTDNAVIIMDAKGNFEWVNEGFIKLFGLSFNEFIEREGINLFSDSSNPNIDSIYKMCLVDKISVNYESYIVNKADEKVWVQTTITPIKDKNDNVIRIVAIETDIRKLKKAEKDIKNRNEQISNQREILLLQNEEIQSQRDMMEEQRDELERQNNHVQASMRYASTIQEAFFPITENMQKNLDYFLLFKPKEIVSGDFYFYTPVRNTIGVVTKYVIAVVDCTGHGVPGAFMSMLGSRLLNEIVVEKKVSSPARILEMLDKGVMKQLKQKSNENNDGMDVALCAIERQTTGNSIVTFAGARRPIFRYSIKENELIQIKGERRPIGGTQFSEYSIDFVNHTFMTSPGDMLYLTSDGIVDQLSPVGKKLGTKRFLNLLSNIAHESLPLQQEIIETELSEHMKYEEQLDDITVLGIRV